VKRITQDDDRDRFWERADRLVATHHAEWQAALLIVRNE